MSHGAGVELVDHLAIAVGSSLASIGLEGAVADEVLQAQFAAVFIDDGHVTGVGGWRRRWDRCRGRDDGRCNGRLDLGRRRGRSDNLGAFDDGGVDDLGRPRCVLDDHRGGSWLGSAALDNDSDGLVDDVDIGSDAVPAVGDSKGRSRKREDRESLDGVHGGLVVVIEL